MGLFGSDSPSKKEETAPLVTPEKEGLRQRRKSPFTKADEEKKDKIDQLVLAASDKVSPQVAEWLKKAAPAIRAISQAIATIAPFYIMAAKKLYEIGNKLPWDILQAVIGLGLCFFGGGYCASIAAVEAFALTGWPTTRQALIDVYEEAANVLDANEEDDKKDEDKNGVRDIDEIDDAGELVRHKLMVAAKAVRDPEKLSTAIGGISTGWLAVQGVLRIKFARVVALAISISHFIEHWVLKAAIPVVTPLLPKEARHWMPTLVKTATKTIVLAFAWYMQTIISAVQSSIKGGLMFSRGLMAHLCATGHKTLGPLSLDSEDSYIDEAFGYSVAALGFYIQWSWGFGLPFPLSLVMLPFDILEWYIRWSISSGGD